MKVTIHRVTKLSGDFFFEIYKGDQYVTCRKFIPTATPNDIFNEERNLKEAIALAHTIEAGKEFSEIVYETPDEEIQTTIGVDLSKIDES